VGDAGEIEGGIAAFARSPNGGLIVTGSAQAVVHKLPAVYFTRFIVAAGAA
jgi:putative ABC transport system substrate-binding protein